MDPVADEILSGFCHSVEIGLSHYLDFDVHGDGFLSGDTGGVTGRCDTCVYGFKPDERRNVVLILLKIEFRIDVVGSLLCVHYSSHVCQRSNETGRIAGN